MDEGTNNKNDSPPPQQQQHDMLQAVIDLMDARALGSATTEQVEAAVSRMLGGPPPPTSASNKNNSQPPLAAVHHNNDSKKRTKMEIHHDTENYDDDDDDEGDGQLDSERNKKNESNQQTSPPNKKLSNQGVQFAVNGASTTTTPTALFDASMYQDIPLGVQGARMMTIFGDGKCPLPAAVAAALQGARRMLQTAIRDARYYRRHERRVYRAAQCSLKADRPHKPVLQEEWTNEILYRASAGHDQLARDPKCGFRTEDLRQLFPEEMHAYERWSEIMHASSAAAAAEEEEEGGNKNDGGGGGGEKDKKPKDDTAAFLSSGGHLQERAAQFDVRTDKMQQDWYMKYAKLRASGSFLPRVQSGRPTTSNLQPQEQYSGWGRKISLAAIRFLHWVGFDPTSALPPPSDDTTSALAFLGYDFFGRICEKAIELKLNNQSQQQQQQETDSKLPASWLELPDGEQLTVDDIERALEHPDVRPVLLYGGNRHETGRQRHQPQLYFGPGFESRLELELDEMVLGLHDVNNDTKPSPEEEEILRQEELLFAKLAEPPTFDPDALALLQEDEGGEFLEKAAAGNNVKEDDDQPVKKKRGRPRKRLAT